MYPYGSGYPPNNNAPYPPNPAYPPNPGYPNQAPYPNASPFPGGAPFGAGYPPNPNTPGYGMNPPQGGSPYPPSGNSAYPPTGGNSAYPPTSGSAYPPTSSPYPPVNPPYQQNPSPYPTQNQSVPQYGAGYPPTQPQQPQYPGAGGAYGAPQYPPSSTNTTAPYPGQQQQQNPSPYPQLGGGQGGAQPYGYHGEQQQSATNMAQCFTEMKGHVQTIRTENTKGTPTVRPMHPFDPVSDANALRKAMKGFGTDEDALINVICRRSNDQRQQIIRDYKTSFGKDLISEIKSETSGNFEQLLVSLLQPTIEFYVTQLRGALDGVGTDEDVLIEMLCTLSNNEIHTIRRAYEYRYRMTLESGIKSDTSGHFERLLVSLCVGNRDESGVVDLAQAQSDAQQLQAAGVGRVGTDEATFNMILCRRSFQQLKLVCQEYEKIAGHSLEQAIKREFSGDIEDGLVAIVQCCASRPEFFAKRLHKAMAGFGTNDNQLQRLLVTRCEIDLADVKVAFEQKYGKSLKSWIKGEASGHYKNALLALIGEDKN
jgi:annexin A7/11